MSGPISTRTQFNLARSILYQALAILFRHPAGDKKQNCFLGKNGERQ